MTCKDCNDNGFWTMKDGTNVTCPCDFIPAECPICSGWGTLPDAGGTDLEPVYCSCPIGQDMKETA